jgi:hypothetical protein
MFLLAYYLHTPLIAFHKSLPSLLLGLAGIFFPGLDPLFILDARLTTTLKAFLGALITPFRPILVPRLTADIPFATAELNLDLVRFTFSSALA